MSFPLVVDVEPGAVDSAAGVVVFPIVPLMEELLTPRDARAERDLGGAMGAEVGRVSV